MEKHLQKQLYKQAHIAATQAFRHILNRENILIIFWVKTNVTVPEMCVILYFPSQHLYIHNYGNRMSAKLKTEWHIFVNLLFFTLKQVV